MKGRGPTAGVLPFFVRGAHWRAGCLLSVDFLPVTGRFELYGSPVDLACTSGDQDPDAGADEPVEVPAYWHSGMWNANGELHPDAPDPPF